MEISTIVLHELNTTQGNNGLNHNISQAVAPHLNADVRALSKLQNLYLTQRKSKPTPAVVPKKSGSKLYVKKKKRKRCISEGGEHAINTVATPPSNGKHLIGHPSPDTRLDTKAHTETQAVASEGNDAKKSKADLPPLERRNSVTLPLPVRALSKIKQRWKNGSSDNLAKATTLKGSTECLRVRKDQLSAMPLPETADNKGMKKKLKAAEESDATLDAIMKERSQAPVTSPQFLASHALLAGDEDELVMLKQCRESTLMQLLEAEEKERKANETEESKKFIEEMMNETDFEDDDAGPVKFFTHELSIRGRLRRFFVRNPSTRLASTFFDLILKVIICAVYVLRVILDDPLTYACFGRPCHEADNSSVPEDNMRFTRAHINWYVLIWVHRPLGLWIVEIVLSAATLFKALLFVYITTKGHRTEQILTTGFFLEVICTCPTLVTIAYPPLLQHLFVPTFLNCWLAKHALERIFNDLHLTRQRFQTISVTLSQQMMLLIASLLCLVYTTICGIQHIQRGSGEKSLTMFESLYFVIVTFSTVGYGDISPDIWLGQLFMILMIVVAFSFIPQQIEALASTWLERQKAGGEFSNRAASQNKHVIVCSSMLMQETVMDFLNEFYAHPKLERASHKKLEEHMVILLCPQELNSNMQVILKDPKWAHRVIFMKGSSLKDIDLKRCRIHQAEACFFLAPRPATDKNKADEHTILRSWAVKDFAPHCKQYIQLFKAKNKMHVKFAEHVVCEDEFKYALLANNCLYPGLSTLVSLLVHTSSGLEGDLAPHAWQQIYGRHSGNEIYHIQLHRSIFFSRYEGFRFTQASADAHQRFGVVLLAVLDGDSSQPRRLQLNPGSNYFLKKNDFCFYMSVTREEYAEIDPQSLEDAPKQPLMSEKLELIAEALQKYHKVEAETENDDYDDTTVFDTITSLMGKDISHAIRRCAKQPLNGIPAPVNSRLDVPSDEFEQLLIRRGSADQQFNDRIELTELLTLQKRGDVGDEGIQIECPSFSPPTLDEVDHRHGAGKVLQFYSDMGQERLMTGPPPLTIYTGSRRAVCHVMRESRPLCCLEWGKNCEHCTYKNANDVRWHHQLIIMAAQYPSSGIHNFIVPLRSSFISVNGLSPIVLLLETEPNHIFLDTIAQFPLVYWIKGTIRSIDDLLKAGINKASHLVVVNRDSNDSTAGEETLADSETIIAVQTVFRMFPNANIITELSQASNMRFMQFSAQDVYSQKVSRLEQKLKEVMASNLNHIFRLPFAAGQVFSASMLDTLLYQTYVKGYLITFVRLLLGIDAEEGSGHMSSIRVKRATIQKFPTYGELYQGLCSATGEIPFAIYRTERQSHITSDSNENLNAKPMPGLEKNRKRNKKGITREQSYMQNSFSMFNNTEALDIGGLIRNRLRSLDISAHDYSEEKKRSNTISYIIANPSSKRKLKIGDIVYVIQPSSMQAKPSKQKYWFHQRSHSFSGVLSSQTATSAAVTQSAGRASPSEHIGRFRLQRCSSEKKPHPEADTCA